MASDIRDLVVKDGQELAAEELKHSDLELERLADDVSRKQLRIAEVATSYLGADETEMEGLTPREKRIAAAAMLPQSEAPVGLVFALRYKEARVRKDHGSGERVNVVQNNNYIMLPPKLPPAPESEVKIIDADELRGEPGDE